MEVKRIDTSAPDSSLYNQDGLKTGHNHDFLKDPGFIQAYNRGIKATGKDYHFHWRVHVAIWAARAASKLEGDFVECGVNKGFISSAVMEYLNWNSLHKNFYLLDTFAGIDKRYISEEEKSEGILDANQEKIDSNFYVTEVESVKANFSEWKNTEIIVGSVPDTLSRVPASKIAYLHLDMNCSSPEVAAAEFFWPKLVTGGLILLDDYAYKGHHLSKVGMDKFASSKQVSILSLPTGQGLITKPPA
jgi:hypothetical protein